MCEKIERLKYLTVKINHITITILSGDDIKHLTYKPNGNEKRTKDSTLYEYELVEGE